MIIKNLQDKFIDIEENAESMDPNELEDIVYQLEEQIDIEQQIQHSHKDQLQLNKLRKKINMLKKEYDFYDPEATMNMMFPDGQDE